jgi:hypothetical protein
MKFKTLIADYIYKHTSFPISRKSGLELNWMFKDICPCCISHPIESLSNYEYSNKYPASNEISLGITTVYLCDYHFKKLKNEICKCIK